MDAGPDLLTLEQIGKYNAMCERGEITKEKDGILQNIMHVHPAEPARSWEQHPQCR